MKGAVLAVLLTSAALAESAPARLRVTGDFTGQYRRNEECRGIVLIYDDRASYDYRVEVWQHFGRDAFRVTYHGEEVASGEVGFLWSPTRLVPHVCQAVKWHREGK